MDKFLVCIQRGHVLWAGPKLWQKLTAPHHLASSISAFSGYFYKFPAAHRLSWNKLTLSDGLWFCDTYSLSGWVKDPQKMTQITAASGLDHLAALITGDVQRRQMLKIRNVIRHFSHQWVFVCLCLLPLFCIRNCNQDIFA